MVKTYVVTLCKMLNFIIFLHGLKLVFRTSQYATMWLPLHGSGTVLVFSIINSSNFIHFTCLRVVSRDFLKTKFTKCAQIQLISIISTCATTVQYRMVYFSYFCVTLVIPITLDQPTQNWVQFIHFSSVEA